MTNRMFRGFALPLCIAMLGTLLAWSQWGWYEERLAKQRLQQLMLEMKVVHAREVVASDASVSTGLKRKFDNRLQHEQALAELVATAVALEQVPGLPLSEGQMRQMYALSKSYCSTCREINQTDAKIFLGLSTVSSIVLRSEQQRWLAGQRGEIEYRTKQILTQTKRDYDVCRSLLRFWSDRLGITDPAREGKP